MKKKLIWIACNIEEILASTALGVTLLITTTNVLLRYFVNTTIPGYSDISVFCFAWAVFLGMSACYKRGMHYGVDFLMVCLPEKAKKVLHLIIDVIVLCGCVVALYLAFKLFWATLAGTGRVSSYLHISYGYMYMSGVLGFGLIVIYAVRFIIKDIKEIFKKDKEEA